MWFEVKPSVECIVPEPYPPDLFFWFEPPSCSLAPPPSKLTCRSQLSPMIWQPASVPLCGIEIGNWGPPLFSLYVGEEQEQYLKITCNYLQTNFICQNL